MTQRINNDFENIALERKSKRNYDPNVKIPREELIHILIEATRAPSSANLQPWRFVIVESEEIKQRMTPYVRFNTTQNDTSSAMILILGDWNSIDLAEEIFDSAVKAKVMPVDVKKRQVESLTSVYGSMDKDNKLRILYTDAGLVAMQLMLVARSHGYDTCPMTGFEFDKILEILEIDSERLVPVLFISIGKALDEGHTSLRLPIEMIASFK